MYGSYTPKYPQKAPKPEYEQTNNAWDKLPEESDQAYQAFLVYRNTEIGRTLERVAERLYGDKWQGNLRFVEDWYKQFAWERRALAYDVFIQDNEDQILEKATRKARMQMADALPDITDKVLKGALGKEKVTREQTNLMLTVLDRVGPEKRQPSKNEVNILNQMQIMAPELPKEITGGFNIEEAEFETLQDKSQSLIPEDLRKK